MVKKPKFEYIEEIIDRHGVKRKYGYTKDGGKFWRNLHEVMRIYEERGIKELKRNL